MDGLKGLSTGILLWMDWGVAFGQIGGQLLDELGGGSGEGDFWMDRGAAFWRIGGWIGGGEGNFWMDHGTAFWGDHL